jgi:hypothetical protein
MGGGDQEDEYIGSSGVSAWDRSYPVLKTRTESSLCVPKKFKSHIQRFIKVKIEAISRLNCNTPCYRLLNNLD